MSDMPRDESEVDERRVYYARLFTCLAVVPTFMGLASALTAAAMGAHDMRALVLARWPSVLATLAAAGIFIGAWWLMGRRRRSGVVVAFLLFTWLMIGAVWGQSRSYLNIVFSMAGLVVVARAWPAMLSGKEVRAAS